MRPKISIIMGIYNCEKTISEQYVTERSTRT